MAKQKKPPHLLSTIDHLDSPESRARLRQLCDKWPRYRIDVTDHKLLDLTECRFIGNGPHEIVAFTFARHLRVARLNGAPALPIWLAAGPHFSDHWHDANGKPIDELQFVGIVRGMGEKAGLVEPLRILAVASCSNGQFAYDAALRELADGGACVEDPLSGNSRFRRVTTGLPELFSALENATAAPAPLLERIPPTDGRLTISIGIGDLAGLKEFVEARPELSCPVFGTGEKVVYAYTFEALSIAAGLAGENRLPVKIGFTSLDEWRPTPAHAAAWRLGTQCAFPEVKRLFALLCCSDGRATEREIHGHLREQKILSPGREWFHTSQSEIRELMASVVGA